MKIENNLEINITRCEAAKILASNENLGVVFARESSDVFYCIFSDSLLKNFDGDNVQFTLVLENESMLEAVNNFFKLSI